MAVIDAVPGVKVSICINGQPVEEYEDSGEEIDGPLASKTVVKYIEAISDAEFTINTTALPAFEKHRKTRDDILVDTKIDGTWVRGRFQRYAKPNSSAPWSIPMEGVSGVNGAGKSTISAFKFTAIEIVETTDKAKIDEDAKVAANLGEICVEIFRVKIVGKSHSKRKFSVAKEVASEISEKAVKGRALSHGTTFGVEKISSRHKVSKCKYLDGEDTPLARFVFRYRSKDSLRKLLLIPRSPSPDPFDALSAAEIQRLARQAFQNSQVPNISRSALSKEKLTFYRDQSKSRAEKMVKRERRNSDAVDLTSGAPPRAKQRKTSMQDPIDLTDD